MTASGTCSISSSFNVRNGWYGWTLVDIGSGLYSSDCLQS